MKLSYLQIHFTRVLLIFVLICYKPTYQRSTHKVDHSLTIELKKTIKELHAANKVLGEHIKAHNKARRAQNPQADRHFPHDSVYKRLRTWTNGLVGKLFFP